ncbi:uncharacterized protein LOC132717778 isoform X2 [Ruditapes philippinarum]|uniref:uncharacterized protein LOC132717778 isoform X2 n=1 Tax=Ruditapes philippinarum TaxID=129788 RepID=UPI00295B5742|nr:uncharacterized protein LOC132717778 isoform X2 [Ruditapes philippinarum]
MEVKDTRTISVILFVALFCGCNSSVLSGLAGFGFSPLEYDVCRGKHSDTRTCYVTQVTNVSCFNARIAFDACKRQAQTFNSNKSDVNEARRYSNWTHLQAYYHRNDGERHRPGKIGSCVELKPGVCIQSRCLKTCCKGWFEDENGQCTKSSFGRCQNGGTYNWRHKNCACLFGFSGQQCEIALCPGGCLNGGQCTPGANGENVCTCPAGIYGDNCQKIRCRYKCENGGQCILDGPIPTCKCPYGYYGRTCAHSYTGDSTCPPPNNTVCVNLNCQDECYAGTCTSGHVCCTDGCCMKCVKPRSPGCLFNGILYEHLDIFRKDKCTVCKCYQNGTTKCYKNPVSDSDLYCGEGNTSQPTQHQPPKLNCSADVIQVPVYRFSKFAYMRTLHIQAKDENGTSLKVTYYPAFIILDKIPLSRRNIELVKVVTQDSLGHTNECYQRVVVVDDTHPMFVYCPTDSEVKVDYRATLTSVQPRARDNVGIQHLYCYPSDQTLPPGLHIISCTAVDYDGNQAFCQTIINVTRTEPTVDSEPIFLSCPSDIYVSEGELVSWRKPVAYAHSGIRFLVSNYDPYTVFPVGWSTVQYTATDYNNNKGHCTFNIYVSRKDGGSTTESHMTNTIRITDDTEPIFLSCPSDIRVSEGELVSWREPMAYDHSGIRFLVSNYDSYTVFPVGWTTVQYTATDYNNNKGYCTFSIYVSEKDTYSQDSDSTTESHMTNTIRITACVSCLVVILVVILVTVMLYRRFRTKPCQSSRSRRSGNNRGQIPIQTISNALYESTALGLDGRPIVPTLKPPPYSPAIDPPTYDEVYVNPCIQHDGSDETETPLERPPAYDVVT